MIAHYFPPGTSSGTLRTVKFAKYLPDSNWEPVILTMDPEAYHAGRIDTSLLGELSEGLKVYRTPVWMPDRFLARLKSSLSHPTSALSKTGRHPMNGAAVHEPRQGGLSRHIRDWLQFPDAYGGWLAPGFWQARKLMRSQKIDLIYSTAPSPVAHMIALLLRKWCQRPWVADFRDPWECLFPEAVYVEGEHPWRQQAEIAVAEKVVEGANLVIANTEGLCRAFRDRFPQSPSGKFVTIPNGFDTEDFRSLPPAPDAAAKFTICHAGTFFGQLRSPDEVLTAIRKLVEDGQIDPANLSVILVGCGAYDRFAAPYLEVVQRVSHKESLQIMARSHVLLLLQQSPKYWLQVPAKTYEYLAARRWILAVTPEGATRDIVRSLPNAIAIHPGQTQDLKSAILRLYRLHCNGQLYPCPVSEETVRQFSREEQTRTLSSHFSRLVGPSA
jgi:glycosyltransferase involved in cell wall biosynthesis